MVWPVRFQQFPFRADFSAAKVACESVLDHSYFAPRCRTLMTKARRTGEFGSVRVLRSGQQPGGWGDPEAVEANRIVSKMIVLILSLHKQGATWSVENVWLSYLWHLRSMAKVLELRNAELILLHQCPYGAVSQNATGIFTTAV
jgi:hypothetical protein